MSLKNMFIIAEIGINHNGSMEHAKSLIDVAKDAGCDAVKFQKRCVNLVYSKKYLDSYRESPWGTTQRDQKEGLEFGLAEYKEIDQYCQQLEIKWFASAWDIESLEFLQQFNLANHKIASSMLIYEDFLKAVAKEMKHTFISTGMSDMPTIDNAVNIFKRAGCPFELMHCISTYPMKDEDANLNCIKTLRKNYGCDIGYSGHETGLSISYAAAAMSITSLERHITLGRAMYGSDQAASLEPSGLRQLVGGIRKIEIALGDGVIRITPEEKNVASKLRNNTPTSLK